MATEESGFRKQIQEELSCSICLELFKRPKALPCQHTYCYNCLLDCAKRSSPLKCPNCRQVVKLPPDGVEGLPDNYLIANLCETFPKQVAVSPLLSTTVPQQEQLQVDTITSCDLHQQHDLSLYCTQCDTPVCMECLDVSHAGHACTSIRQAVEQKERNIWQNVSDSRQKLDEDSLSLKGLRCMEAELRSSKDKTEAAVVTFHQDVVKKMEENKDMVLLSINKNYQQNLKALDACRDVLLTQMGDLSTACTDVEQAAGRGPADFLQQGNSLLVKLNNYKKVDIPTLEPSPTFEPALDSCELILGRVIFSDPQEITDPQKIPKDGDTSEAAEDKRSRQVIFGGWGLGCGKFQQQASIAVSKVGQVFVLDSCRVQTFNLEGSFLYQFSPSVPGADGGVMMSHGIAPEVGGHLWIVGTDWRTSDFLVKYSDMGQFLAKITLTLLKYHSRQVAVNQHNGKILVTEYDGKNSKIKMFNPTGKCLPCGEINLYSRELQVHGPPHIATDIHGNIFVVDSYQSCITSFDQSGKLRFKFGSWGHGVGCLHLPHSICTDSNGNVIVAEHGNTHLKLFAPDGQYLHDIDTDMEVPWKLAAGPEGQLVVSDASTHLVKILKEY
ncbi:TRIM2 [Branchiostoma lanceolatum]|uniref:RING-type E3 ubiquitin transferase n=1 Tax=Branchiostoma lanceolatum TaxID=7740 RepID=A0A8J9YLC5_BRALA|nr:TRIM2 [Branchiostoma lanceolatum]